MNESRNLWLVEDDAALRESIRQFLLIDFDVFPFGDLQSVKGALHRLGPAGSNERPDIVLLDLSLPDGNGFDLIVPLKRANPAAVVLVLSGQLDLGAAKRAISLGADDYVLKSDQLIPELLIRIPMARERGLLSETSGEARIPQNDGDLSPEHFERFVEAAEKRYFSSALKIAGGSATKLASKIGLGRSTVFKKLSDLGLSRKDLQ